MQITQATLPLLALLQGFGINRHVRGWNRALSRLFPHDRQSSRHVAVRRWGLSYLADPTNYVDWTMLCHGGYEEADLDLFRRLRRPGTCLDIGGNVGHHTLFFGSLGWTVDSFEPNPQLWPAFEAKVAASGLKAVTLHRVGLGAEDVVLTFELENRTNSGTGRFTDSISLPPAAGSTVGQLPIRNGDRYLREAGIARVDVVTMVIQGFEPEALAGLRKTLLRDRPLVALEIASDNTRKFGSFDALREHLPPGYSFLHARHKTIGFIRTTVTETYNGRDFAAMRGNLFCVPTCAR